MFDTIGPFIGLGPLILQPFEFGNILFPNSAIEPINEGDGECAPAAVARSIHYMDDLFGHAPIPDPQAMSDTLALYMFTNVFGWGTGDGDLIDGKDDYCEDNELPICSELVYGWNKDNLCEMLELLGEGYDIEVLFDHHVAMLTSIIKAPDGSAIIGTIDDPEQEDGVAENETHYDYVAPDGSTARLGGVDGFLVECWDYSMCYVKKEPKDPKDPQDPDNGGK